jgi:hypothetical protein
MIYRLSLAPASEESKRQKCSTAAFPKLFTFGEVESRFLLFQCQDHSQRTVAPPPCLPLDIKDSLKEDIRFFDGGFLMGVNCLAGYF